MSGSPQILANQYLDDRLRRDGFVTFPFLGPAEIEALRAGFGDLKGWEGEGFQSDLVVDDPAYRRAVSTTIGGVLDERAGALFVGHRPFLRNYLCKHQGDGSELYLHRDWMYVDERDGHRTYVVWVALQDIDGSEGQLEVLPGSHLIDGSLRGTSLIGPWLDHQAVIDERLVAVPVRAGDAVVFDNSLVHRSRPNRSDAPRLAVAVGMAPATVPLVHFRRADDVTAERYDVDDEFFVTATPQGLIAAAPDLVVRETVDAAQADIDAPELARRLDGRPLPVPTRRQRARSAVRRRLDPAEQRVRAARAAVVARRDRSVAAVRAKVPDRARARQLWADLPSKAAIVVLGANEAIINRFGPDHPAVWDPSQFEWAGAIEAGWSDVVREVRGLLEGPTDIPHIEDVTGGIPQGNIGPWRTFVMMHQGRWIDWNCDRCPETTALVRNIPGLTVAGFSVLEPGTHITTHRGPNKGALRYQLGVIVPGRDGDCRIRVGDEMLVWRDGEGVMFDFTVEHEAWNDSDGIRVLLMLEVITPLPWYLAGTNALAQRAMGWFPTTRDITQRLRRLEPTLVRPPRAS